MKVLEEIAMKKQHSNQKPLHEVETAYGAIQKVSPKIYE